jgi:hypothetical protein
MGWNPFDSEDYENPADAAMPYLEKIPGAVQPYYQPYIDTGTESLKTLQDQYNMLLNDPTIMMSKIGSSYTASPGYQYNVDQATAAANNAAAAGGYLGSPAEQENLAKQISGIASQDYDTYMNQALAQYGLGLQGTQGLNQMGYNASTGYAGILDDLYKSEANLSYAGQANQNAHSASGINNLMTLGGAAVGGYFGGPAGATAGAKIGSSM